MTSPDQSIAVSPRRQLNLFDATCIMAGIVIGAGIFRTPPLVANLSSSIGVFVALWVAGGVASLLGALCFAELTSRYPEDGGTFAFLQRAYGPWVSVLFAWTDFWIVRPSNLGAVAFILADYAHAAVPLRPQGRLIYALSAVMIATTLHVWGLKAGRWSQNLLTVLKVVGLLQIAFAAFTMLPNQLGPFSTTAFGSADNDLWRAAQGFVLVMFCYGGWSDLSYVAAEVRNPRRNMLWAMLLGVSAITLLYLLVNLAALYTLGLPQLARSTTFGGDIFDLRLLDFTFSLGQRRISLPECGGALIGLLVVISCFGALVGMVFTGARVYFALGMQHRSFAWLGQWSNERSTPSRSLLAQGTLSCALLCLTGSNANGFERLVILNSSCYWGFMALVAVAVIVLRRDRVTPVAFRVPGYPLAPLLFTLICLLLVAASLEYARRNFGVETIYSGGVLLSGLLVSTYVARRPPPNLDRLPANST